MSGVDIRLTTEKMAIKMYAPSPQLWRRLVRVWE